MFSTNSLKKSSEDSTQVKSPIFFVRTPEFSRTLHLAVDSVSGNGFNLLGITRNAMVDLFLAELVERSKSRFSLGNPDFLQQSIKEALAQGVLQDEEGLTAYKKHCDEQVAKLDEMRMKHQLPAASLTELIQALKLRLNDDSKWEIEQQLKTLESIESEDYVGKELKAYCSHESSAKKYFEQLKRDLPLNLHCFMHYVRLARQQSVYVWKTDEVHPTKAMLLDYQYDYLGITNNPVVLHVMYQSPGVYQLLVDKTAQPIAHMVPEQSAQETSEFDAAKQLAGVGQPDSCADQRRVYANLAELVEANSIDPKVESFWPAVVGRFSVFECYPYANRVSGAPSLSLLVDRIKESVEYSVYLEAWAHAILHHHAWALTQSKESPRKEEGSEFGYSARRDGSFFHLESDYYSENNDTSGESYLLLQARLNRFPELTAELLRNEDVIFIVQRYPSLQAIFLKNILMNVSLLQEDTVAKIQAWLPSETQSAPTIYIFQLLRIVSYALLNSTLTLEQLNSIDLIKKVLIAHRLDCVADKAAFLSTVSARTHEFLDPHLYTVTAAECADCVMDAAIFADTVVLKKSFEDYCKKPSEKIDWYVINQYLIAGVEIGKGAMMCLLVRGHVQAVKAILVIPDIDADNTHESTSMWAGNIKNYLIEAAEHGRADIVAALLRRPEVNVNKCCECQPEYEDYSSYTAITMAIDSLHLDVVALLLLVPGIKIKGLKYSFNTYMNYQHENGNVLRLAFGKKNPQLTKLIMQSPAIGKLSDKEFTEMIHMTHASLECIAAAISHDLPRGATLALTCQAGYNHNAKIIEFLLSIPGVDANEALRETRYRVVMKRLITVPGVTLSSMNAVLVNLVKSYGRGDCNYHYEPDPDKPEDRLGLGRQVRDLSDEEELALFDAICATPGIDGNEALRAFPDTNLSLLVLEKLIRLKSVNIGSINAALLKLAQIGSVQPTYAQQAETIHLEILQYLLNKSSIDPNRVARIVACYPLANKKEVIQFFLTLPGITQETLKVILVNLIKHFKKYDRHSYREPAEQGYIGSYSTEDLEIIALVLAKLTHEVNDGLTALPGKAVANQFELIKMLMASPHVVATSVEQLLINILNQFSDSSHVEESYHMPFFSRRESTTITYSDEDLAMMMFILEKMPEMDVNKALKAAIQSPAKNKSVVMKMLLSRPGVDVNALLKEAHETWLIALFITLPNIDRDSIDIALVNLLEHETSLDIELFQALHARSGIEKNNLLTLLLRDTYFFDKNKFAVVKQLLALPEINTETINPLLPRLVAGYQKVQETEALLELAAIPGIDTHALFREIQDAHMMVRLLPLCVDLSAEDINTAVMKVIKRPGDGVMTAETLQELLAKSTLDVSQVFTTIFLEEPTWRITDISDKNQPHQLTVVTTLLARGMVESGVLEKVLTKLIRQLLDSSIFNPLRGFRKEAPVKDYKEVEIPLLLMAHANLDVQDDAIIKQALIMLIQTIKNKKPLDLNVLRTLVNGSAIMANVLLNILSTKKLVNRLEVMQFLMSLPGGIRIENINIALANFLNVPHLVDDAYDDYSYGYDYSAREPKSEHYPEKTIKAVELLLQQSGVCADRALTMLVESRMDNRLTVIKMLVESGYVSPEGMSAALADLVKGYSSYHTTTGDDILEFFLTISGIDVNAALREAHNTRLIARLLAFPNIQPETIQVVLIHLTEIHDGAPFLLSMGGNTDSTEIRSSQLMAQVMALPIVDVNMINCTFMHFLEKENNACDVFELLFSRANVDGNAALSVITAKLRDSRYAGINENFVTITKAILTLANIHADSVRAFVSVVVQSQESYRLDESKTLYADFLSTLLQHSDINANEVLMEIVSAASDYRYNATALECVLKCPSVDVNGALKITKDGRVLKALLAMPGIQTDSIDTVLAHCMEDNLHFDIDMLDQLLKKSSINKNEVLMKVASTFHSLDFVLYLTSLPDLQPSIFNEAVISCLELMMGDYRDVETENYDRLKPVLARPDINRSAIWDFIERKLSDSNFTSRHVTVHHASVDPQSTAVNSEYWPKDGLFNLIEFVSNVLETKRSSPSIYAGSGHMWAGAGQRADYDRVAAEAALLDSVQEAAKTYGLM